MRILLHTATGKSKCRWCKTLIPKGAKLFHISAWAVDLRLCELHAHMLTNTIMQLSKGIKKVDIPDSEDSRFNKIHLE